MRLPTAWAGRKPEMSHRRWRWRFVGEAFINLHTPGDAEDVMKIAIERANEAIFQMSNELPQLSTMATTIVALHLSGNIATIGHVGDSRLYRLDSNGTLYRETQDHSVVEEEVRAGRMTPEQALTHPSRNIISRALGAEPTVEVDLKTIMFEPNSTFLICSDGITRHIPDDEINALLFSANPPNEICKRMKELCYERGAEDNLTAVVVKVSEATAETSEAVPPVSADFEQDTIATARQPLAATAGFSDSAEDIPTGKQADENYAGQNFQAENQVSIPAAPPPLEETFSNDYIEAPKSAPVEIRTRTDDDKTAEFDQSGGNGFFGKLLGGLALLLLGLVLGAAGYYYFSKQEVVEDTVPVNNKPADESINFKSFEQNRRNVDNDPAQFIQTYRIKSDNAEDSYLLGRAHLLMKNYPEASKNFTEAKNRLVMANTENRKILATEIAMGLAIINGQFSQKEFEKELPAVQSSGENKNANSAQNILQPPNGGTNSAEIQ